MFFPKSMDKNQGKKIIGLSVDDLLNKFSTPIHLQNPHLPPPGFQYPPQQNILFHSPQYPQFYPTPIIISDHESGTRIQTTSSNSLGRTALENINLNDELKRGKKPRQNKKWSREINTALISAWLNVSKNPAGGVDHSSDSYWQKIANRLNELTGESRTVGQCKSHWNKTNPKVSHFNGCYKRARVENPGGSELDCLKQAHKFYEEEKGKQFNVMYWWDAVNKEDKWNDLYMQEYSSGKGKVSCKSVACTTSSGGDTNENNVENSQQISENSDVRNKGKGKLVDTEENSQIHYSEPVISENVAVKNERKGKLVDTEELSQIHYSEPVISENVAVRDKAEELCQIHYSEPVSENVAASDKGKGKLVDTEEHRQIYHDVEVRKLSALEKIAEAQKALAEAQKAQANAQIAQVDAQKFNTVLEVLTKDTSNMSYDQKVKHEQLCDLLRSRFFSL